MTIFESIEGEAVVFPSSAVGVAVDSGAGYDIGKISRSNCINVIGNSRYYIIVACFEISRTGIGNTAKTSYRLGAASISSDEGIIDNRHLVFVQSLAIFQPAESNIIVVYRVAIGIAIDSTAGDKIVKVSFVNF